MPKKRKAVQKRLFLLALSGLWLLVAFLVNGGATGLPGLPVSQDAQAVGLHRYEGAQEQKHCTSTHRQPSFGSPVVIDSGEVICSNLTSFGSTIVIRGVVIGNVVAFGGSVLVSGKVQGNILLYGADVTLQNDASVYGDIHLCGGQHIIGTNDSIGSPLHGALVDCPKSVSQLLLSDVGINVRFWSIIMWVALGLLLNTLLPEHVMLIRTTVTSKTRRSFALGLLSTLLIPAILIILIALIIPIPLAIILAIGFTSAWALGMVAVGSAVGDYIVRSVAPQQNTRIKQVVVGLTVLIIAGSLPYIGLLINVGAGLIGLGAVFLSRFGTRLYSQPKQPILL